MKSIQELAQDQELKEFCIEFAASLEIERESEDVNSQYHVLYESNCNNTQKAYYALLRYVQTLMSEG